MLRIYLTNLGKYNEGELLGEWIDLPVSRDELIKVFDRIQICHDGVDYFDEFGNPYEEYFVTDYETDFGYEVGEYESIEKLSELAEQLDNMNATEREALEAFIDNGCSLEEALDHVENGDYVVFLGCNDMTDVACQVVSTYGYLDNIPDTVARYFDYEAFGRDLDIEGNYIFINNNAYELIY